MIALAKFVAQTLKCSDVSDDELRRLCDQHNRLFLGVLIKAGIGLCRHRSILFKYLCDDTALHPDQWCQPQPFGLTHRATVPPAPIFCRLLRGRQIGGENHAWNTVLLDGKYYVVDVTQYPDRLLEEDSIEAKSYQRLILGQSDNKVVPFHSLVVATPFPSPDLYTLCPDACRLGQFGYCRRTTHQAV